MNDLLRILVKKLAPDPDFNTKNPQFKQFGIMHYALKVHHALKFFLFGTVDLYKYEFLLLTYCDHLISLDIILSILSLILLINFIAHMSS